MVQALWTLPLLLSDKEDALTQEEFGQLFSSDETVVAKVNAIAEAKANRTIEKNPMVKIMVKGSFHEMIRRGFFEKYSNKQ